MNKLVSLFLLYRPQGILKSLWTVLRILILPFKKINAIIPQKGTILDIGCGNGGLTNYLSLQSPERNILGIDLSKKRLASAKQSVGKRKNIKFILGDITEIKQSRADCYLIVDVLHHINFKNQEKLLKFLARKMNNNSILIIKEINPSNRITFLFGHIIEKILYPKDKIYARPRSNWENLFNSYNLSFRVVPGVNYFPDSTLIFIISYHNKTE